MPTAYIKPPITEAVIELRFGSAVTQAILSRFLRSVRGEYPAAEQMYEVAVQIQTGESSAQPVFRPTQRIAGYKVTGLDSADVIMFGPDRIATIRMAPYFGWEKFISKAKTNFQILQKITGHRSLVRLATRYVNRLDIPRSDAETIRTEEYLLVEPIVPAIIPNIQSFTIQFVGTVPEIESRVIVNAGSIPSPLIITSLSYLT